MTLNFRCSPLFIGILSKPRRLISFKGLNRWLPNQAVKPRHSWRGYKATRGSANAIKQADFGFRYRPWAFQAELRRNPWQRRMEDAGAFCSMRLPVPGTWSPICGSSRPWGGWRGTTQPRSEDSWPTNKHDSVFRWTPSGRIRNRRTPSRQFPRIDDMEAKARTPTLGISKCNLPKVRGQSSWISSSVGTLSELAAWVRGWVVRAAVTTMSCVSMKVYLGSVSPAVAAPFIPANKNAYVRTRRRNEKWGRGKC